MAGRVQVHAEALTWLVLVLALADVQDLLLGHVEVSDIEVEVRLRLP